MEKINIYVPKIKDINPTKIFHFQLDKMIEVSGCPGIYIYDEPYDEFLRAGGSMLAVATKLNVNGENRHLIVFDSSLEKLPEDVRNFNLMHELGHLLYEHLDSHSVKEIRKINFKRSLGIFPKIEVEADAFAGSVLGVCNAKQSLMFMIKNTNMPIITKLELAKRYFKLGK